MTGYDAAEKYIEKLAFGWLSKGIGMVGGLFRKAAPTALSSVTDLTPAAMNALKAYNPGVTAVRQAASTTPTWLNRANLGKAGLFAGGMAADHLLFNNNDHSGNYKMATEDGYIIAEKYIDKIASITSRERDYRYNSVFGRQMSRGQKDALNRAYDKAKTVLDNMHSKGEHVPNHAAKLLNHIDRARKHGTYGAYVSVEELGNRLHKAKKRFDARGKEFTSSRPSKYPDIGAYNPKSGTSTGRKGSFKFTNGMGNRGIKWPLALASVAIPAGISLGANYLNSKSKSKGTKNK